MQLQRTERFDKSLDLLKRGDGRAMLAARCAESIIRALAAGDLAAVLHKLTCNGEARLEKGVKFDLGGGYRLVSVRQGKTLLLLFAGSHDDCDRWLERHRGVTFTCDILPAPAPSPGQPATLEPDPDDPGLEVLHEGSCADISQRDLRRIFCGLCGIPPR